MGTFHQRLTEKPLNCDDYGGMGQFGGGGWKPLTFEQSRYDDSLPEHGGGTLLYTGCFIHSYHYYLLLHVFYVATYLYLVFSGDRELVGVLRTKS